MMKLYKAIRQAVMICGISVVSPVLVLGQQTITNSTGEREIKARYERAESMMQGVFTSSVVRNATIYPTWIGDQNSFWYIRDLKEGKEYRLFNADRASNKPAFDHKVLAKKLSKETGETVEASQLPLVGLLFDDDLKMVSFGAFGKGWQFDRKRNKLTQVDKHPADWLISPDGSKAAFVKGYNIWLKDLKTGEEHALTRDGEEYFAYARVGATWAGDDMLLSVVPEMRWSPDGKRLFTIQRDLRQVKDLPIVHHVPMDGSIRPTLEMRRYAFQGEEHIETRRLVIIDLDTASVRSANYRQIPTTRNGYGLFAANLGWWGKDSQFAYFIDVDRYYKYARVIELNAATGETRLVFEETSDTNVLLMQNGDMKPVYLPLPETDEILWYSERSGWAHLYLYNLKTGKLKNVVTQGDWLVREVVHFDVKYRELYLQTGGRTEGRNPYYRDLVRVNIDTGKLTEIVSSNHDYFVSAPNDMQSLLASAFFGENANMNGVSPGGNFTVVTRSRVDTVPVSLLLDRSGKQIATLETADVSGLPTGWQWPEPVKLTAADGKADIYGVIYRPSNFDPKKSYPVLDDSYNQPDLTQAPQGAFENGVTVGINYFTSAALAELGFIVVQVDGRGGSYRSKSFRDYSYGAVETASALEDHVAGIQQLAERYSYMDMARVGIATGVNGGPGGIEGLLHFPGFYKVGVQGVVHDSRLMGAAMWGDMFEGPDPRTDVKFPEELVDNLQGKLLLIANMVDAGATPPAATFRIVEALRKANKDFDFIALPNMGHSSANGGSYVTRRSWDFLVKHLQGITPPKGFKLHAPVRFSE